MKALQEGIEDLEMEKAKAESELWDINTKIKQIEEELQEEEELRRAESGIHPLLRDSMRGARLSRR